jgi:hypothetical protein
MLLTVLLIALLANCTVYAQEINSTGSGAQCVQRDAGRCFDVRGRYAIYVENNGIWVVGTRRMLSTAGDSKLDKLINEHGDWQDYAIMGNFRVCPTSKYEHGHMQGVCVQSYRNLKIIKRP